MSEGAAWRRRSRGDQEAYAAVLGQEALERQRSEAKLRCLLCWAPHGEAHAATCPNRPEDEAPLLPSQEEGLF